MRKNAFTLAEVLITLGIIGIVAALTIPTLVRNYQKTQFVTGYKKFYSQFNQVLQQMAVESGENDSIASYFAADDLYLNAIKSLYKISKDCGIVQDEECFAKLNDNYDGSTTATTWWDANIKPNYKLLTADGMSFALFSYKTSCTTSRGFAAAPDAPVTNHVCGYVLVDVNGKSKPNYYGRDVFFFFITSNKKPILYPFGGFYHTWDGTTGNMTTGGGAWWNYGGGNFCGGNASKIGERCAGRIMEKGFEMDY